jgi:phosphatidylserine/phosphatidylglycerophosphate/cardiolipin synthase-like enzyme
VALGRDIVALYRTLVGSGQRLFGSSAGEELRRRFEFQSVLGSFPGTAESLAVALQALAVQEQELQPRLVDAEVVATLPSTASTAARPTHVVVEEMLASASRNVVALGYEIDEPGFVKALHEASRRVGITLIVDRERSAKGALLKDWPAGVPRPVVFQDKERDDAATYAKMHGKALLVDGRDLLVSSANFTFHGFHGNVEFGVRLRGAVAGKAADLFRELALSGLLERVS